MTKTNNYIDEILDEEKLKNEIVGTMIIFKKHNLEKVADEIIKTVKRKLQEQRRFTNSGRKMYQQGQKDKVKEVIKEIERKKEFSQFKLDKKLSKTLSMYYQGINDTMYDLIGFLKSLKEDK